MMKYLLAVFAACLFVVSPVAAHPPQHHSHPSHPGHPGHVAPGPRSVHYHGYAYRGVTYRHYCYQSTWRGYSYRAWSVRYGCYCYWCPAQVCWFRYDGVVFIPFDACVNINIVP